jgi:transcriptional regulator with XRE-family HTH domain
VVNEIVGKFVYRQGFSDHGCGIDTVFAESNFLIVSFSIVENSLGFGQLLRSLRQSRGWNLSETARRGGIGRVTLHRWENDAQTPRLPEAEALLTALGASAQERRQALARIDAPRAKKRVRETFDLVAQVKRLGPVPCRGDLLRALRRRQGLSLEAAAAAVPVSTRTLRAWENDDVWPSVDKLHALCHALGAQEKEVIALTCLPLDSPAPGPGLRIPRAGQGSLDADFAAIEARQLRLWHRFALPYDPLVELDIFALIEQAWWLAARHTAGRLILASVYAQYAHFLSERERFGEITPMAERSLALLDQTPTEGFWLYAGIASARDAVYRGGRPAPQRGIDLLRQWLATTKDPQFQAWILSDMAKYQAMFSPETGAEEALALADRAGAIAGRVNPIEGAMRQRDKAKLLLLLKRPGEALDYLDYTFYSSPPNRATTALLLTEAHLERGAFGDAHDWLQTSWSDIAACEARPHLLRRATELTHRLEQS